MKILQLGKFYPVRGGVEKVMWDFTKGLSERGIDCDMLCAKFPSDPVENELKDRVSKEGRTLTICLNEHGRIFCVPSVKKIASTMIAPAMVFWLRSHRDDYDIIHVHHPDPMACLSLFLSGYRGRVFVHWHSDILKQRFFLFFYRPLQNWLLRRAEIIVGTTPVYVRESPFLKSFQDKVTYLPIGVRPVDFDPAEAASIRARYNGRKIIFSLGRLVGYKGFSILIRSAKYLGPGYQILIGGEGPLKDELNRQIVAENVENYVSLLGFMSNAEVHGLFCACDVFVLSSIWKTEAFGIVQIEAMSCGKPVVATKIPESGVSWVNEDGKSGINVPVEDAEALAAAIRKITISADAYSCYSKGAKARYENNFTFDSMIDNLIKIYN